VYGNVHSKLELIGSFIVFGTVEGRRRVGGGRDNARFVVPVVKNLELLGGDYANRKDGRIPRKSPRSPGSSGLRPEGSQDFQDLALESDYD